MEAVAYLAPAIAPLAIKLIDKYIFDDQRAPVPQIIQIPAPSQCACCCGQQFTNGYNSRDRTCSTCSSKSFTLSQQSTKHHLSARSNVRSSSTGDAYEKGKSKASVRAHSDQRLGDGSGRSGKKLDKHTNDVNTLAVLASHLKKEISVRNSKGKSSSRCSESRSMGQSSSSSCKYKPIIQKSSRRMVHESNPSSRKSDRDSDGSRVQKKAACSGC